MMVTIRKIFLCAPLMPLPFPAQLIIHVIIIGKRVRALRILEVYFIDFVSAGLKQKVFDPPLDLVESLFDQSQIMEIRTPIRKHS